MAIHEELEAKYDESEILPEFTREEGLALVDLAHLVLLIDQELTTPEIEELEERVFGLTLDEETVPDVLASGDLVEPMRVQRLVDDADEREAFIESRTSSIEGEEHRRVALRLFGTLSYTDGMNQVEQGVCHEIGRAFGFDDETLQELLVDGAVDVWELGGGEDD